MHMSHLQIVSVTPILFIYPTYNMKNMSDTKEVSILSSII